MNPGCARLPIAGLVAGLVLLLLPARASAQAGLPEARPVPPMQVIPLPDDRASIQRDGRELTVYHFGPALRRPFLFPVIGPAGRSLTRMGHPHDPVTHSHHNSIWVAHHDVNGESFWDDRGPGRIVHRRIVRYDDGEEAGIVALNAWVGKGERVHMMERRRTIVRPLPDGQWLLILDLQFEPEQAPVILGATPFGMVGVRMARTIGVHDGGGRIRNSEGHLNEQGPNGAFRKRARWVDYSGPIAPGVAEGITLLDHPTNPNHPSAFHVRDDGWMGASLTLDRAIKIEPGKPLRLRYGFVVHAGVPEPAAIDRHWNAFAREPIPDRIEVVKMLRAISTGVGHLIDHPRDQRPDDRVAIDRVPEFADDRPVSRDRPGPRRPGPDPRGRRGGGTSD